MIAHPAQGSPPIACRSPILSLCFIGQDRLVVATAGNTFWLNTAAPGEPHDMETHGNIVCALAAVSESLVYGLSPDGQLLSWTLPEGHCFKQQHGPPPGDLWGLVRLVHWESASALVYGAGNGDLVLCSMQEKDCDIRPAHSGELYAIASSELYLLTAGRHDRRLKLWVRESPMSVVDHPCPFETTSAAFITEHPHHVILVDTWGRAEVFNVGTETLHFLASIPGNNHRVVNSPDFTRQREDRNAKAEAEAKDIMAKTVPDLFAKLRYGHIDEEWQKLFAAQCQRLEELGYPHIALHLRADAVGRQGDRVGELRFRHLLNLHYSGTDQWSVQARILYADLLMASWRFANAANVFDQLTSIAGDADCSSKRARAKQMQIYLDTEGVIADTADSLKALIQSAGVVGSRFSGRWVVAKKRGRWFQGVDLLPSDILSECQKENSSIPAGVTSVQEKVTFVRLDGIRNGLALVFEGPDGRTSSHIQFLLVHESGIGGCTVTPMLVLSANVVTQSVDVEKHNNSILAVLGDTPDDWGHRSWIGETVRVTGGILQTTYTRKTKEKNWETLSKPISQNEDSVCDERQ
jgi:hypothetical protein